MGETGNTLHVLKNRRLILQVAIDEGALPGSGIDPDPIHRPENVSSGGTTTEKTSSTRFIHTTPFDSSMVLTVLVLLTALFFMGFFSLYIRRFSQEDPSEFRRRRHSSPPALLRQNQKRSGVDSSTVRALPTVPYRGGANQLIADCSICLSEFEEGETVKLIPHCRHVFHSPCLDTWLASHVSCPLCRGTQFFETAGGRDRDEVVVRLDVVAEEGSDGGGRPTVDGCDTWRGEMMRRTGSSANLGDRPVVLHRSFSF